MKNKDYLNLWDKHSDIHKFNLDGVYSLMFVEDGETIDNVLDEQYVAGVKPYGFRPGKPRSLNVGAKYQF